MTYMKREMDGHGFLNLQGDTSSKGANQASPPSHLTWNGQQFQDAHSNLDVHPS